MHQLKLHPIKDHLNLKINSNENEIKTQFALIIQTKYEWRQEISSLNRQTHFFIEIHSFQKFHSMKNTSLVKLSVNSEMFLHVFLRDCVQHASIHKLSFKCSFILRQADIIQPTLTHPILIQFRSFWVFTEEREK